jgi:hypothetical protein
MAPQIKSPAQAPDTDAGHRNYTLTSGTILLILTFALWCYGVIDFHRVLQGNLLTVAITSLLAGTPLFQHPTSTALLLLFHTGFFSSYGYSFVVFACVLSLRRSRKALLWTISGSLRFTARSLWFIFKYFIRFVWSMFEYTAGVILLVFCCSICVFAKLNLFWFLTNDLVEKILPHVWEPIRYLIEYYFRQQGIFLPEIYWETAYELCLCKVLRLVEQIRLHVQPGHSDSQMNIEEHKVTIGVLQGRVSELVKILYWMRIKATQDKDLLEISDDHYATLFRGWGKLTEVGSTARFPVIHNFPDKNDSCDKSPILGCCVHDVEKLLRGTGKLSEQFLKEEMRKWHPDRWVGRGKIQAQAQELFTMMALILEGDVID